MAQYQVTLPSNEIVLTADSETDAYWRLARYFGKKADGVLSSDPEFALLGIDGSAVSCEPLVPETAPVIEAPAEAPAE